ncbi:MAG: DEAD/DEAH box helicase [Desulfoarculaceae bacterium]|nr:DEAD/DEAH box helicase [Desulfoarculaceae bacterium]
MTHQPPLLQSYSKLNAFEQTFLQFLSIVYEPPHITLLVNCLTRMDMRSPRGTCPTAANLTHYFSKLLKMGLVTKERQCAPEITEILSRISVAEGTFSTFAEVIRKEAPVSYYYGKWTTRCWRAMREMRIGIYTQQFDLINDALDFLGSQCKELFAAMPPTVQVITTPFDPVWLRTLPPSFQFFLLNQTLRFAQSDLLSFPEVLQYLQDKDNFQHLDSDERLPFQRLLFNQLLLQGELDAAQQLITGQPESFIGTGAIGSLAFLRGDYAEARRFFSEDLEALQQLSGNDKVAFFGPPGLFHLLACLQEDSSDQNQSVAHRIGITLSLFAGTPEEKAYHFLAAMISAQNQNKLSEEEFSLDQDEKAHSFTVLFAGLCSYWLNSILTPETEKKVEALYQQAREQHYNFFALNLAAILAKTSADNSAYLADIETIQEKTGQASLVSILEPEEPWKRSLQALIQATTTQKSGKDQTIRMAWFIDAKNDSLTISPKEQKISTGGQWSKGRPIALSRLYSGDMLPYLTIQDRKIGAAILKIQHPETHGISYQFDMDKALVAMIGHPLLFLTSSPGSAVEFVAGEPELLVEERGGKLHIRFAQAVTKSSITVFQETPTRFKIIAINDNHRRIAQITGTDGLSVPLEASEQVLTAIGNISSYMTVHSAIAADVSSSRNPHIEFVEADPSIYIHLLPSGSGFRLEMFVKPFAEGGHYLKPGQGVENIMAEVKGKRLQTRRNLALEEENAREIEESCSILDLAIDIEQENDREWHLQDPDDCLQALMELQAIHDRVTIEWPEGEKLTVTHQASLKNLNLKIRTNRQNWFSLSGHLELDQDTMIDLRDLLSKVKGASSRFVQIGEGQFLALTQEFKKRLEELNTYAEGTDADEGGEILLHPLASLPLEQLIEQAKTTADAGWEMQQSKLKDLNAYTPLLPSTLQAELRDYQLEGYNWLARLVHWGVGGCLADDMGLGKTIQSLAILLELSSEGPSLVIAPTSVSINWETEVNRFAPTLNIKSLTGKDRKKTIQKLGKFDILITTYTLLQQENETLSQVKWQAVILDEAQAIKNAATKRSKAAMALQARFRLITTGTPIENHLGELWNLFHFINPGLLGSLGRFNERFAIPIERYHDREARLKLKKLIRPFILRRLKSEVLEELPSRTEITLHVAMSKEEIHFYEALRQNALETLEHNQEKKGRHLQILTEIMKLRQACCHPRLIAPDTNIPSAKLEVFSAVIEELLGGRHKALVFSQFIGHLQILREYLDSKGISYKYLDGSTSTAKRKQQVDEFQSGEGDLFLISLKAGGLGLNLTAADYVIHMDPWWNPAIEDQASDRAHRIGQTRPVTIYRLICKQTIEEKIVKLHQEKRDLAGSLLEGTDISAKMTADDLLNLIKEM